MKIARLGIAVTLAGAIGIGVIGGAIGLSTPSFAEKWDMPVRSNERNYMTENIQKFVDEVAEASDGAIEIVLHPEDSLVRQPDVPRAVQTGQVPIGEYFVSMQSNESPIFGIDSVPFLATDYDSNRKLAEAARPALEEELKAKRLRLLFIQPWPPQGLYADREVNALSDLQGVSFRAYNPNTARMAELMGARPVTIQQAEVPQAFSTGVIEAMLTSPATGVDTQAWDFVSRFYDARAFIPWNIVVVNERTFQGLDEETQNVVLEASKAAEERAWQRAPEVIDGLIQTLAEHGMQVQQPGPELQAGLQEVGDQMLEEWMASAGEEGRKVVERYRSGD